MELLFWIDALKRASAASVTAVIPYFSYAKGDKKDEPRVSIRGAGLRRRDRGGRRRPGRHPRPARAAGPGVLQAPRRRPVRAAGALRRRSAAKALTDLVVVAPDAGFAKKARQWANRLRAPPAIADKRRVDHTESAEVLELIGDGGGADRADRRRLHDLRRHPGRRGPGAGRARRHRRVRGGEPRRCSTEPAIERLDASPIERLFITDSVETQPVGCRPRSRSSPSPGCSARRSGASPRGRASRSCSSRAGGVIRRRPGGAQRTGSGTPGTSRR